MQKTCKNCTQQFEVTDGDLKFYDKVSPIINGKKHSVPPPLLCPDCRQQRRLAFRNERMLYHNKCNLCGESMITIYSPDKKSPVYCTGCWWGDKWDSMEYGRDFDFSKPFFKQIKELWDVVPKLGLLVLGDNENSDYTHDNYKLKNCYLTFDGEQAVDCYYGETFDHLKDSVDFLAVKQSELLYECINCQNCYNVMYSRFSYNCSESAFLDNCIGCKNCFGCANLHQKEFYIFNKQYSPEEYKKKVKSFNVQNYSDLQNFKGEFEKFCAQQPKKVFHGKMNENVTGDNLVGCKDTFESYDCNGLRDCKFCTNMIMGANDCMDVNIWGDRLSLAYNSAGAGAGSQNIIGCYYCGLNSNNIYHSIYCWQGSSNLFGCVGLGHKSNCILNKQYSKDEWGSLVSQIIEHMKNTAATAGSSTGEWSEFFPIPLSAFGYNETVAQDFFPLTRDEAIKKGYKWKDPDPKEYKQQTYEVYDDIKDVPDSIINETLACEECGKNYKIIPQELVFYRKMNVPVPHKCSICRHFDRMAQRNPRKLWKRECNKCNEPINTPYSPNRPETVYCEKCYLKAVY